MVDIKKYGISDVISMQLQDDKGNVIGSWDIRKPEYHETQYKERYEQAVEDIRSFLIGDWSQRPPCQDCVNCKRFRQKTDKRVKYRFSCDSYCPEALQTMANCGFIAWEPFIKYALPKELRQNNGTDD